MQVNTFKQYDYTADLYSFTQSTDSEGGIIRNYAFERSIRFRAVTSAYGRLLIFLKDTEDDVINFTQLFNFKDGAGTEIRPGGIWTISEAEPHMNMWGRREGFKARLNLTGTNS